MRRVSPAAALALVTALGFSAARAGSTTTETTGVIRVERAIVDGWHFGCHADACQGGPSPLEAISVTSPSSETSVDIVVTVTMDYQTTPGDFGVVRMRLKPAGSSAFDMRPGDFRLDSSGALTTTSVSWIAKGLPASGTDYEFRLLVLPRRDSGDAHFHIRGRHLTVVIEMWSPG
jgi:hypothetical protein